MTVIQDRTRGLLRLLAVTREYTGEVNAAIVSVWDAAWANVDHEDESLVSLAETLADKVVDFYLYGGDMESVDLAARCFVMADFYITTSRYDSPSPA
jgi:hypothetical protein